MTTKERPIIFSGPMVRAILEGKKTQTRRLVKRQCDMEFDPADPHFGPYWLSYATEAEGEGAKVRCPYGKHGDRLWVREAFALMPATAYRCSTGVQQTLNPGNPDTCAVYREGWERSNPGEWRPSIFMPRWASRITMEITGIRVERLQQISEADAIAEGIAELSLQDGEPGAWWSAAPDRRLHCRTPRGAFLRLWRSIHGDGSWETNPWVWVVEFRRVGVAA